MQVRSIEEKGNKCIKKHSSVAMKVGIVPVACIPFIHGICIKLIMDLNKIAGFKGNKSDATDIFANAVVGVILTPMMAVPVLSVATAGAYIESVGESYLKVLIAVIDSSSDSELNNNKLMTERIKKELLKLK